MHTILPAVNAPLGSGASSAAATAGAAKDLDATAAAAAAAATAEVVAAASLAEEEEEEEEEDNEEEDALPDGLRSDSQPGSALVTPRSELLGGGRGARPGVKPAMHTSPSKRAAAPPSADMLVFESRFESANLRRAVQVSATECVGAILLRAHAPPRQHLPSISPASPPGITGTI